MTTGFDPFLYRNLELETEKDAWGRLIPPKTETKNSESFQKLLSDEIKEVESKIPKEAWHIPSDRFHLTPSRREILEETKKDPAKKKLYDAAVSFEGYFLEQMFREMKKNIHKTDLLYGGPAEDWFDEMLTTERVGKLAATSELGLAEQIYASMRLL